MKIEELKLIEQLLNPNRLMLKFEIKKASNCINIYDPLHAFLGFSLNTEEKSEILCIHGTFLGINISNIRIYKSMKCLIKF